MLEDEKPLLSPFYTHSEKSREELSKVVLVGLRRSKTTKIESEIVRIFMTKGFQTRFSSGSIDTVMVRSAKRLDAHYRPRIRVDSNRNRLFLVADTRKDYECVEPGLYWFKPGHYFPIFLPNNTDREIHSVLFLPSFYRRVLARLVHGESPLLKLFDTVIVTSRRDIAIVGPKQIDAVKRRRY